MTFTVLCINLDASGKFKVGTNDRFKLDRHPGTGINLLALTMIDASACQSHNFH
jgi:hypothetical protein